MFIVKRLLPGSVGTELLVNRNAVVERIYSSTCRRSVRWQDRLQAGFEFAENVDHRSPRILGRGRPLQSPKGVVRLIRLTRPISSIGILKRRCRSRACAHWGQAAPLSRLADPVCPFEDVCVQPVGSSITTIFHWMPSRFLGRRRGTERRR